MYGCARLRQPAPALAPTSYDILEMRPGADRGGVLPQVHTAANVLASALRGKEVLQWNLSPYSL
jgi:hypothetical protein